MAQTTINKRYSTNRVTTKYPHVGLFDVVEQQVWIARRRLGVVPIRLSHARLLKGGTNTTSTADKDQFMCIWYHTPDTGEGSIHGYPIEWSEAHLLVRMDPNWSYRSRKFIPSTDIRRVERNIDRQFAWGEKIFRQYAALKPAFPLSWHFVGPRAADSMFYVQRIEGKG